MLRLVPLLTALCVALTLPAATSAAIVKTYADRPSFVAAVTAVTVLPLGLAGAPPVLVPDLVVGDLTLTAFDGRLAGDGVDLVSTEFDGDTLILAFAKPIFGIGLFGGVVDADFVFFDGELFVDVVDSGTTSFITNSGTAYLGLLSDIGFTQVRLSIASFDGDFSSIAFVGLQRRIDQVATVPEPGAWALMLVGFAFIGTRQRARRTRSIAA